MKIELSESDIKLARHYGNALDSLTIDPPMEDLHEIAQLLSIRIAAKVKVEDVFNRVESDE